MHRLTFFLIFLSAFIVGCNSNSFEEHELGGNLIDNSTNVTMVDTFTIKSSTVIMDSLITSGLGNVSIGRYTDPLLGTLTVSAFSKIDLGQTFKLEITDEARLDSVILVAYSTGQFWGDTTQVQTINVHRVTEEIEYKDDKNAYYNNQKLIYETEILGSKTFNARPKKKNKNDKSKFESFRIKLNQEFGEHIMKDALLSSDDISKLENENKDTLVGFTASAPKWEEFLQGIALIPGNTDNASVMNFQTDSLNIRLYYKKLGADSGGDTYERRDFNFSKVFAFSNFDVNKTGSLVENLVERTEELDAELSDNLTFVQGGVGLYTRIDIPYLEKISHEGIGSSVLKAELLFYPAEGTDNKDLYPLEGLPFTLHITDDLNRLLDGTQLIDPSNNNSPLVASYLVNEEFPEDTPIRFDITSYVNNVVLNGKNRDEGLFLKLTEPLSRSFPNRIAIENDPNSDLKIKLRTTFAAPK